MTIDKWDSRILRIAALEVATWSKDPNAGVGCVIVSPDRRQVTWGFNGFPKGIADTEARLNDRAMKLELTVHAELNALLNAGVDVTGWTLYVSRAPCVECALAIIQKGIARVVSPPPKVTSVWYTKQRKAADLLAETKVICDYEKLPD